jgi:carbamoyltransferase
LEETVKKIVTRAINKYKRKNIALAGGVSMNCKMNGSILYDTPAEDVFAFPVSNDAGGAIGAAMHLTGSKAIKKLNHAYYGPSFSADKILNILENLKVPFSEPESIALKTAKLLEEGKLVGWFQGRMEFGPRALGDRSILANPLYPDIKDKINKTVKFREPWRPFCPSILNEHRSNYMEKDKESPFMIIAHRLQKNHRGTLSSICHIDGTIRPQTVSQEQNNLFYELLMEFERLTGYGVLLNTSFNVQGEPIVCNPTEAVRCFYGNGLDALAIGPYLLEKK